MSFNQREAIQSLSAQCSGLSDEPPSLDASGAIIPGTETTRQDGLGIFRHQRQRFETAETPVLMVLQLPHDAGSSALLNR